MQVFKLYHVEGFFKQGVRKLFIKDNGVCSNVAYISALFSYHTAHCREFEMPVIYWSENGLILQDIYARKQFANKWTAREKKVTI